MRKTIFAGAALSMLLFFSGCAEAAYAISVPLPISAIIRSSLAIMQEFQPIDWLPTKPDWNSSSPAMMQEFQPIDWLPAKPDWNSIKDDFEDVVQKSEIYAADDSLLLTLSENEQIFYLVRGMEHEKWDYSVHEIPPEARRLCTIVHYRELEPGEGLLYEGRNIIYYDDSGYYNRFESSEGVVSQNKMSEQAGLHIIEFAGLDPALGTATYAQDQAQAGD